jgi:hypothetical protein
MVVREWLCEWGSGWLNEWVKLCQWVTVCVSLSVCEWVIAWVCVRVSVWVNEREAAVLLLGPLFHKRIPGASVVSSQAYFSQGFSCNTFSAWTITTMSLRTAGTARRILLFRTSATFYRAPPFPSVRFYYRRRRRTIKRWSMCRSFNDLTTSKFISLLRSPFRSAAASVSPEVSSRFEASISSRPAFDFSGQASANSRFYRVSFPQGLNPRKASILSKWVSSLASILYWCIFMSSRKVFWSANMRSIICRSNNKIQ